MSNTLSTIRLRLLLICCVCAALLCGATNLFKGVSAQASRPVLVSEATSTRAIAFDSVTHMREPFPLTSTIRWTSDSRTRIAIFAMNLSLEPGEAPSAVTAEAEDSAHRIYPLKVEHVAPVPAQAWLTSVIVRLHDQMGNTGDVLVRIRYHNVGSNRVRVGVGHVGGGLPDDPGSVPTPGIKPLSTPTPMPSPASTPTPTPTPPPGPTAGTLTANEVRTIIAQAVSAAIQSGRAVTVAVVDREGNALGVFQMSGASSTTQIRGGAPAGRGLEGMSVPSTLAAISKAGTAAFFSTMGNAFTTRTAGFIVQEHFPPGINFRPGGPLFGVQFSSLPCSDIKKPGLPLGLSADPGSMPIYKNGVAVGGVGIEGDGVYGIDKDPSDFDQPFEEVVAVSAVRGFETPAQIRGDNILIDGIRLPFVNVTNAPNPSTIPFANLPGVVVGLIGGAQTSAFRPATVGGIGGEADPRFFPFIASGALTFDDVNRIIGQAAQQANITRAAIRQPLGSSARVSIAVVDTEGHVLGIFRTADAPVFGFDVSVQKARAAAFFSKGSAAAQLRSVGFGSFVDRAAGDGLRLDGSVAFSDRAVGFLHRPFFPDGIDNTAPGPFSTPINEWSVFNVGLQLDLIKANLLATLGGASVPCTSLPSLPNGIQIFAGSVPLYKNGALVGAIGVSGDGIDQDDIIAAAGSNGYVPPVAIRADRVFVRGVRLPFVKFPRSPNL